MFNYTNFTNGSNDTHTVCMDPVEFAATVLHDRTSHPTVRFCFGLIYCIIFVLGIGGNTLVILSVYRNKCLQSVRNTFIVSLSCSDIAVCLTSMLITPITTMVKQWMFGDAMCYLFPLFQGMSIFISTFTLTAVAIDRYILIIHPTKPPIKKELAICMIISIWIMAASLSIPTAVHSNPIILESSDEDSTIYFDATPIPCGAFCDEKWPSTQSRRVYGTVVLVLQFLVPLTIIGYSYTTICLKLMRGIAIKTSLTTQMRRGSMSDRQKSVLRRKQRTNRMLISMVVIFASCWFLQVLINILNDYNQSPAFITEQPYAYGLLFHSIAMTSTCWNPILYAGMNEAFRDAFFDLLPCLRAIARVNPGANGRQKRLMSNVDYEGTTALNTTEQDTNRRLSPPMWTENGKLSIPSKLSKNGNDNGAVPL